MIEVLIYALLIVLVVSGLVSTLLGFFTVMQFIRLKKEPMDESNRINHIRLWWFALTRPELFVERFPWLKNDEWDNFGNK